MTRGRMIVNTPSRSMKTWSRIGMTMVAILAALSAAHAQDSVSVTWALTANGLVTQTVGNVVGENERFSESLTDSNLNLQVRDYNASGGGQRCNLGLKTWPAESAENFSRWVQFSVSPAAGSRLIVNSIACEIGGAGTSAMNASMSYAIDSTFLFSVVAMPATALPNGGWLSPSPSYLLNLEVVSGQALYVRIHPWYNSTNASTSKYITLRNMVIRGMTYPDTVQTIPVVTTSGVSNVTATSATCGGVVTWDGGLAVTERGVCWDTSPNPTIQMKRTVDGAGSGAFSSAITGLTTGSFYYVRAYATNASGTGYGNEVAFTAVDPPPRLVAFPGAEGWGKYTVGGRGGAVYEVTNLDDSGPGSLRAAVQAYGPRTVVFRVSGTIMLNSNLTINNPYITIAGQTAPGDGICLRKYPLVISANQVIVRYIRVRLGDESGGESDAISARDQKNIILDHVSASWSQDETVSIYWCDSITVQWCLITESLYNSNHPKGAHGYGGIWGGSRSTYHHNLLAHHSSRNPRFASGCGNTDFRNNVIYNWGFNSAYGGEAYDTTWASPLTQVNMVANYYKKGPATKSGVVYRIINPSTRSGLTGYGYWHLSENYVYGYPTATADNWTYGVQGPTAEEKAAIKSNDPFPWSPISQGSAEQSYLSIIPNVGAVRPKRDSVDLRVVRNLMNGDATFEGPTYRTVQGFPTSAPITGIIDSQTDVGGWPVLSSLPAPADGDHDGMPDDWENSHGLNANDPSDRNGIGENGYTNVESYINSVGLLVGVEERGGPNPEGMRLEQNYPNPFNPSTTIEFTLGRAGSVDLKVYDILGQLVDTLYSGNAAAGIVYRLPFEVQGLSSGIYFSVLESGGKLIARRMIVAR